MKVAFGFYEAIETFSLEHRTERLFFLIRNKALKPRESFSSVNQSKMAIYAIYTRNL